MRTSYFLGTLLLMVVILITQQDRTSAKPQGETDQVPDHPGNPGPSPNPPGPGPHPPEPGPHPPGPSPNPPGPGSNPPGCPSPGPNPPGSGPHPPGPSTNPPGPGSNPPGCPSPDPNPPGSGPHPPGPSPNPPGPGSNPPGCPSPGPNPPEPGPHPPGPSPNPPGPGSNPRGCPGPSPNPPGSCPNPPGPGPNPPGPGPNPLGPGPNPPGPGPNPLGPGPNPPGPGQNSQECPEPGPHHTEGPGKGTERPERGSPPPGTGNNDRNGHCFCEENWKNLTKKQKDTIKDILEFFKSQTGIFTGEIEFLEISYSVDYIHTYLSYNRKDIKEINEIYFLSVLNFEKLNYGYISSSSVNLQYTLSLIKEISKNTTSTRTDWNIWYRGYNFSYEEVLVAFQIRGTDIHDASIEILENIFHIIIAQKWLTSKTVTLPNNPNRNQQKVLETIKDFLITEEGQKYVIFDFSGAIVVSQKIFTYAEENKINISQITITELYEAIRVSVETPNDLNSDIVYTLTEIIYYIRVQDYPTGYTNYYGLRVSVDFFLSYLYLQEITIEKINVTSLEQAIVVFQEYKVTYENSEDLVIVLINNTLKQGQETGSISYQGYVISITEIRRLGNEFTEQNIQEIIISIIRTRSTTTQTPPGSLPQNLTEAEIQRLEIIVLIIQSGVYDEDSTFEFLGIQITYRFVIQYLENHHISIVQLDVEILYEIIIVYVNNLSIGTSNTDEAGTTSSGTNTGTGSTDQTGTTNSGTNTGTSSTDESGTTSSGTNTGTSSTDETGTTSSGTNTGTSSTDETGTTSSGTNTGTSSTDEAGTTSSGTNTGTSSTDEAGTTSSGTNTGTGSTDQTGTTNSGTNTGTSSTDEAGTTSSGTNTGTGSTDQTGTTNSGTNTGTSSTDESGTTSSGTNTGTSSTDESGTTSSGTNTGTGSTDQTGTTNSGTNTGTSSTDESGTTSSGTNTGTSSTDESGTTSSGTNTGTSSTDETGTTSSGTNTGTSSTDETGTTSSSTNTGTSSTDEAGTTSSGTNTGTGSTDQTGTTSSGTNTGTSSTDETGTTSSGTNTGTSSTDESGTTSSGTNTGTSSTDETGTTSSGTNTGTSSSDVTDTPSSSGTNTGTGSTDETETTTNSGTTSTIGFHRDELVVILEIFQLIINGNSRLLYFTYENLTISSDFCLTYLYIQGISIDEANVTEVYQAILVYLQYERQYGETQDLILILILNSLKEGKTEGTIYYQDYVFSLTLVIQTLQQNGYNIQTITIVEFEGVISTVQSNLPTTTTAKPQPLPSQPTQQQQQILLIYVEIFQSGTYDISQYISLSGYEISIEYILVYLNTRNIALSQITADILYEIILQYVEETYNNESSPNLTTAQLTQEEENALESILEDIQSSGVNSSENITFDGHVINTSFFITYLSINGINIHTVTIQELYYFAEVYIQIEQQIQISNSEISIQEAVTLQLILNVLRGGGDSGDIIYEGEGISVQTIFDLLLLQNLTIADITYEKLYYIIYIYRLSERSISLENVHVPENANATLSQLLQFLREYRERASGTITFNNKSISIHTIWEVIQTLNINIEDVDVRYLWVIIQSLTVGETVDPEQALYQSVIQVFETANEPNGTNITLQVNGKNLTVETLAQILNVSRDSSGKYNISGLTEDEVWEAVTNYVGTSVTGTAQIVTATESSTDILQTFKNGVEQYNEGYTVYINYNGQRIPIQEVIEKLGLSQNNNGNYVVPDNLTDQDIYDALNSIISSTTTAS